MDATVFNLANNSSTTQEVDLFNTSDQGGEGLTEYVWNFKDNWAFTPKEGPVLPYIYEEDTLLFWDQTKNPQDGSLSIRLWSGTVDSPTTFIRTYTGALLNNLTKAGLLNFLNTNVNFSDIGTWYIDGPFDRTSFVIRVIPTAAFISANNILVGGDSSASRKSDSRSFNHGVQSFIAEGVDWQSVLIYPSSSATAPAFVKNPNVSIQSYGNFSYQNFLFSTIQRTYDIKNFEIWSPTQNQLLEPFLFDRTLATGRVYQKVLTPTIDPYQSQNYIITPEDKGYILDGFTKIRYNLLPLTQVRLILDYNYIDFSTALLIKKVKKPKYKIEKYSNQIGSYNPAVLTPLNNTFTTNIKEGYDKFGCNFLQKRLTIQQDKLDGLVSAGTNPRWQDFLRERIGYIEDLMSSKGCNELDDVIDIGSLGPDYVRKDLWMPSPAFVQHQIDTEQGLNKLLDTHDFPMEKE